MTSITVIHSAPYRRNQTSQRNLGFEFNGQGNQRPDEALVKKRERPNKRAESDDITTSISESALSSFANFHIRSTSILIISLQNFDPALVMFFLKNCFLNYGASLVAWNRWEKAASTHGSSVEHRQH